MTAPEIASAYGVSLRTAKRYRKAGAPVDDTAAMQAWIEKYRSRMGVGKYTPRVSEPAPVRAIVAEIVPGEPTPAEPEPTTEKERCNGSNRLNALPYRRYVDSGGSDRCAQVWLLCTDQLRKFKDSAQKNANDATESETKFLALCAEVIMTFDFQMKALPKLLALQCDGVGHAEIEAKATDQIQRTLNHAVTELADQLRGTSLERLLPH